MTDLLLQDLRIALRGFRRHPGFTAMAVTTLALGIGANSAIFSVADGVLRRPLPYERPEALVVARTRWEGNPRGQFSLAEYWDLREQTRSFERVAAYSNGTLTLTGSGRPERLRAGYLSADAIPLLGVPPARGRSFAPEEDLPGRSPVVILSDGLWRRRFRADPDIIGRTLVLDDAPTTVIGVMPPGFQLPMHYAVAGMELWTLLQLDPAADRSERGWHWLEVIGRLRPGSSVEVADREVVALVTAMRERYPNEYDADFAGFAVRADREIVGSARPAILALAGAVALLLLAACVNVAGLLLARAESRQREIALRAVLGAGSGRIVRQLLTESVVLAAVGGAVGMVLAAWLVSGLVAAAPVALPRLESVGLDWRLLAFTAALTLGTGVLFGLVPALQAARPHLHTALAEGGRGGTGGRGRHRIRRGLVVGQIALALILGVGAGLLLKSFVRLRGVDPGFVPEHVLTARLELSPVRYRSNEQIRAFYQELTRRLQAIPGVISAATVKALPLTEPELGDWSFLQEGKFSLPPLPSERTPADWQVVSPAYFATMRIPVLQGRAIEEADRIGAPGVVVVNRTLARRVWPAGDALGKRVLLGGGATDSLWRTVIGVVADVRHQGLDADPRPLMYLPHAQFPAGTGTALRTLRIVIRSQGEPARLAGETRAVLAGLDPDIPLVDVQTMEEALGGWAAGRRLTLLLVGGFALVALALGAVGVYGVTAHLVAQRTREIGIRMALGAVPGEILRLVVGQGLRPAALGIIAGGLGALLLARLISGFLFETAPHDPAMFAVTVVLVALVAGVATSVPALRAVRVGPSDALRSE